MPIARACHACFTSNFLYANECVTPNTLETPTYGNALLSMVVVVVVVVFSRFFMLSVHALDVSVL